MSNDDCLVDDATNDGWWHAVLLPDGAQSGDDARRAGLRFQIPARWCAMTTEKKTARPKPGWITRSFEDGVRVFTVFVACSAVTAIFGLPVTMALIGIVAAALALALMFGRG